MTGHAVAAAITAGVAVALLVPPGARSVAATTRRTPPRRMLVLLALPVVAVIGGGSPRWVVLLVVGVGAGVGGMRLWRSRAARLAATATSTRVLESCEAIAVELGAGRPPATALDRATEDWPELAPVAEAHRVGADVPAAWRQVACLPGAADLRVVAAAWQVSYRTGEGLADTLDRVAVGLREAQSTRRVVEGELASARATAKLVAALPLLALTMGNGAGGDPWGFLFGNPVGLGCLALGLAFAFAGLAWIEALAAEVDRP